MMFPKSDSYSKKRKSRAVKRLKPAVQPEEVLQDQAEELLEALRIPFIRVPDPVYRYIFSSRFIPDWVRTLVAKYISGLPDLTLLFSNGTYLCVELKSEVGKLRVGQKRFRDEVGCENYVVCRSLDEFVKIIGNRR